MSYSDLNFIPSFYNLHQKFSRDNICRHPLTHLICMAALCKHSTKQSLIRQSFDNRTIKRKNVDVLLPLRCQCFAQALVFSVWVSAQCQTHFCFQFFVSSPLPESCHISCVLSSASQPYWTKMEVNSSSRSTSVSILKPQAQQTARAGLSLSWKEVQFVSNSHNEKCGFIVLPHKHRVNNSN